MNTSIAEFDLIARIRARAGSRGDVVLGIGDDAALLQPPAGMQLVVAMDTLNSGVHFPPATAPADIGWKALAVNLSDLAAMGALPAWCTLSLSLPEASDAFVDGFLDGFLELARQHDVALVGGDTTRGPLSVCVTAHGLVEPGMALRRDGARVGDEIWVSGTLGDAAGALAQWQSAGDGDALLRARLDRPTPRVALGRALRGIANACIDVSDGLLADLGHIAERSRLRLEINALQLPHLPPGVDPLRAQRCQLAGGDDYELAFTAAPEKRPALATLAARLDLPLWRIGWTRALHDTPPGVTVLDADGQPLSLNHTGFDHFAQKT